MEATPVPGSVQSTSRGLQPSEVEAGPIVVMEKLSPEGRGDLANLTSER